MVSIAAAAGVPVMTLIAKRPTEHVAAVERRTLSATFISRLVGTDFLRVFLGLEEASAAERRRRAQSATDELLARMPQDRYGGDRYRERQSTGLQGVPVPGRGTDRKKDDIDTSFDVEDRGVVRRTVGRAAQ